MITDTFDFSRQNVKTDTAYRQDIYWVWPYMAAQLILPQDDIGFVGNDHSKLISDEDTAALKKTWQRTPADILPIPMGIFPYPRTSLTALRVSTAINTSRSMPIGTKQTRR